MSDTPDSYERQSPPTASPAAPMISSAPEPLGETPCSPEFIPAGQPRSGNARHPESHNPEWRVVRTGDPFQSELEFLHLLEGCDRARTLVAQKSSSLEVVESMLSQWQSAGRPHPAKLRGDVVCGRGLHLGELARWSLASWKVFLGERQSPPTASPAAPMISSAPEPLGETPCSGLPLLDLFLGWSLLQVLRTHEDSYFYMKTYGEAGQQLISEMKGGAFKGGTANLEGLTDRIVSSYEPTLLEALSKWRKGQRRPRLDWWDLQKTDQIRQSPLAQEFLSCVQEAIQSQGSIGPGENSSGVQ